jgi:hypothetical protein
MKLSNSKYGIYISFTTNMTTAGFRFPKEIAFYQVVGGEFDLSINYDIKKHQNGPKCKKKTYCQQPFSNIASFAAMSPRLRFADYLSLADNRSRVHQHS